MRDGVSLRDRAYLIYNRKEKRNRIGEKILTQTKLRKEGLSLVGQCFCLALDLEGAALASPLSVRM